MGKSVSQPSSCTMSAGGADFRMPMRAPIMNTSAAAPESRFIIATSTLKMRSSSLPRLSNASKNPSVQMEMVTELSPSDKRRTPGGVRFRTRERKSRDFAFGTRDKELHFP